MLEPNRCVSTEDLDGCCWVGEDDMDSGLYGQRNCLCDVNSIGYNDRTLKQRPYGVGLR